MKQLLTAAAFLLALMIPLHADPEKIQIVLLPVLVRGDYQPVSARDFQSVVLDEVKRRAPEVSLKQATDAELLGLGYSDYSQPPTPQQVKNICAHYQCSRTTWLTVRFHAGLDVGELDDPSVLVSVTGAARLVFFLGSTGEATLDEPSSATHSVKVGSGQATITDKAEQTLSRACVNDLAETLVALGNQALAKKRVADWERISQSSAARPRSAPASPVYKRLSAALRAYQTAVKKGDILSAADRQRESATLWHSLAPEEKEQAELEFPGTEGWLGVAK